MRSTSSARYSSGPRTARLTKALVYDRAGCGDGVGASELQRRCRRVHADDHAASRALADGSGSRRRRDHRADQERGTDGGRSAEGDRGRRAGVRRRPANPTSARPFAWPMAPRYHGDPGYFRRDYEKTLAVTAGRRQARREQVPHGADASCLSVVPKERWIWRPSRRKAGA